MGEFASNAKANTGVALGATGLGLAVLNGLGAGILGNIGHGPNNPQAIIAQKDAEISLLKSENYSDKVGKEVYAQSAHDNNALRAELYAYIKPLADEAANNRVNIARLEEQQKCASEKQELREQILTGKINEVAIASNGRFNTMEAQLQSKFNTLTTEVNGRFAALDANIACLAGRVNQITSEYVPACKVTPIPMPLANSYTTPATGTTFYPGCVSVGTASSDTTTSSS